MCIHERHEHAEYFVSFVLFVDCKNQKVIFDGILSMINHTLCWR
jgi:hypothetical protein